MSNGTMRVSRTLRRAQSMWTSRKSPLCWINGLNHFSTEGSSRSNGDIPPTAPLSEPALPVLPAMPKEENDDALERFGDITQSSSAEVWKRLTRLLLSNGGPDQVLLDKERYLLEECIKWWARRRTRFDTLDPQSGRIVWPLWNALVRDGSPGDTGMLNRVLDHWRLCVKQEVPIPVSPPEVLSHVSSLPSDLPDLKSYTIILSAMAYWKHVDPEKALSILRDLPTNITPTVVLWNAALTLLAKVEYSRYPDARIHAESLFDELSSHPSMEPDDVTYTCLMETIANSQDENAPNRIHDLIGEMNEKGLHSPIARLQLVRAWAGSKSQDGAEKAHQILNDLVDAYLNDPEHSDKPIKQFFSVVMEGYAKRGQPESVEKIMLQLQDLYLKKQDIDFLPTAKTFNSVLSAYSRCPLPDRAERAEELLMSMREIAEWTGHQESRPDATTINTVINVWAESKKYSKAVDRAEKLLRLMGEWPGIEPDSYSFTSVMKAWARSNRPNAPSRCESYLRQMWKAYDSGHRRVRPSSTTYATVVYAWSRSKNKEAPIHAEAVYREMVERFKSGDAALQPTEATFMTLMTTWNRSELPEARSRVQYYFDQMRDRYRAGDKSLRPTAKVYNAMMMQLKKAGDGPGAEKLLKLMISDYRSGNDGAQPNTMTFNTALSAWANSRMSGREEKAERLLVRMHELHRDEKWECEPNAVSYSCILDCWAKSNLADAPTRAEAILDHMKKLGKLDNHKVQPTSHDWATAISAWSRSSAADSPERAHKLLQEMQELYERGDYSLRPSGPAYASLISCWARSDRDDAPQRALEVLREMEKNHASEPLNEAPNRIHYSATINAFASRGDADAAEKLLEEMLRSEAVAPHDACFNAVLKAIAKSQKPDAFPRAQRLFEQMKKLAQKGVECAPTVATYTTLLDILRLHPTPESFTHADSLLQEMVQKASAKGGKTPSPNAGTFLTYLRVLAASDIVDKKPKARELVALMKAFDCRPTKAIVKEVNNLK